MNELHQDEEYSFIQKGQHSRKGPSLADEEAARITIEKAIGKASNDVDDLHNDDDGRLKASFSDDEEMNELHQDEEYSLAQKGQHSKKGPSLADEEAERIDMEKAIGKSSSDVSLGHEDEGRLRASYSDDEEMNDP